jgi:hypothetical protein
VASNCGSLGNAPCEEGRRCDSGLVVRCTTILHAAHCYWIFDRAMRFNCLCLRWALHVGEVFLSLHICNQASYGTEQCHLADPRRVFVWQQRPSHVAFEGFQSALVPRCVTGSSLQPSLTWSVWTAPEAKHKHVASLGVSVVWTLTVVLRWWSTRARKCVCHLLMSHAVASSNHSASGTERRLAMTASSQRRGSVFDFKPVLHRVVYVNIEPVCGTRAAAITLNRLCL